MIGHPSDIVQIREGSFSVSNLPTYRCANELTGPDDVEEFGDCDVFQALGLTSKPFPPTTSGDNPGAAEALILRDVGNTDAVVGARDSRCAFVYGSLNDGDTVVHSVDPSASAQVQCKANRQVMMVARDSEGDHIQIVVDGKNDKLIMVGFGGLVELSKKQLSLIGPEGKAQILIKDSGEIMILGKLRLGGLEGNGVLVATDPASIVAIQGIVPQLKAAGNCACTLGP